MPLYDVKCLSCGSEELESQYLRRNESGVHELDCRRCGKPTSHQRLLSLPAKPLFDRPLSPQVAGGSYDTMGEKPLPMVPQPDAAVEYGERSKAALKALPIDATRDEVKQTTRELGPAPSATEQYEHLQKPEIKERVAHRESVRKENKAKKRRAGLIEQGHNIDMRRDKLPGDPNLNS